MDLTTTQLLETALLIELMKHTI